MEAYIASNMRTQRADVSERNFNEEVMKDMMNLATKIHQHLMTVQEDLLLEHRERVKNYSRQFDTLMMRWSMMTSY